MTPLLVVDDPDTCPLNIPGATLLAARDYLCDPAWSERRGVALVNLCRGMRYQSQGYYVSLLAQARGHRPIPDVAAIQGLRATGLRRVVELELDDLITRCLRPLKTDRFELSVYFGRNLAERYERLARALFQLFPSPLMRAVFERQNGSWRLRQLKALAVEEIPAAHREFVADAVMRFLAGGRVRARRAAGYRYDLAILRDENEVESPSNRSALARFASAARRAGLRPSFIDRTDLSRLATFDALLIRETTYVDHHTFRFAQRARALGLAVIDDPESIIRCTNKVYLAELLRRHRIPTPPTMVVHAGNRHEVGAALGFPCVLKKPDSGFSQGVHLADDEDQLQQWLGHLFDGSDLVIAQGYTPSAFDWRIGVIDREPLFACRYHMAPGHWQVIAHDHQGKVTGLGDHETIPLDLVPAKVLKSALRAAALIGDGLYGVDIKEVDGRPLVIEVNDNPNIDHGVEDQVMGDRLYDRVIAGLVRRIEAIRNDPRSSP